MFKVSVLQTPCLHQDFSVIVIPHSPFSLYISMYKLHCFGSWYLLLQQEIEWDAGNHLEILLIDTYWYLESNSAEQNIFFPNMNISFSVLQKKSFSLILQM